MTGKPIPDGYHTVTPYLVVPDVARLLEFLKQAFDAQPSPTHAEADGTIRHAEVRIGDSMIMIGQGGPEYPPMPAMLYLYAEDVDAVYKRAIAAGGVAVQEVRDQFYGDRSGGVKDAFGNQWWVATHIEDVSPEEMQKRMAAQAGKH